MPPSQLLQEDSLAWSSNGVILSIPQKVRDGEMSTRKRESCCIVKCLRAFRLDSSMGDDAHDLLASHCPTPALMLSIWVPYGDVSPSSTKSNEPFKQNKAFLLLA